MGKAFVIGLGNILEGDHGAGCYVLDALRQESLGDSVDLLYLGERSCDTGALVYGAEFVVIVQAMDTGDSHGAVSCWDKITFLNNIDWFALTSPMNRSMAHSLIRAELSGALPDDLLFVWLEPKTTEGLGISTEMRKQLRQAVRIIKDSLYTKGYCSKDARNVAAIYRLEMLHKAI